MLKDALKPPKLRILTYAKGIFIRDILTFYMIYTGHCSWLCQERVHSFLDLEQNLVSFLTHAGFLFVITCPKPKIFL